MNLGEVCNINKEPQVNDIQQWIMLMQVWGAHIGNMPHLTLAESRHKAHSFLQICHDKLEMVKQDIAELYQEFGMIKRKI